MVKGGASFLRARAIIVVGYVGAVVGAGFASGQEVVQFFLVYGYKGFLGAVLASFLFIMLGGILLYIAHQSNISNYQSLINHIFGERMGLVIDLLITCFLFFGISVMLSASGAIFYEHLYLPKIAGIIPAYFIIFISLLNGRKGLITSYNLLVPIKIILLLGINSYIAFCINNDSLGLYMFSAEKAMNNRWVLAAVLYVAYNFSLAMVVLTEYQAITSRRDSYFGAILGGLVLGVLLLLNFCALTKGIPQVLRYEVPMLFIAGKINDTAKFIYLLVLWIGILTTAIANTYGFTQRLASLTQLDFKVVLILTLLFALPLSMIRFSDLVGLIYPLFGIIGILVIGAVFYQYIKDIMC